jgi:hypothetical protein
LPPLYVRCIAGMMRLFGHSALETQAQAEKEITSIPMDDDGIIIGNGNANGEGAVIDSDAFLDDFASAPENNSLLVLASSPKAQKYIVSQDTAPSPGARQCRASSPLHAHPHVVKSPWPASVSTIDAAERSREMLDWVYNVSQEICMMRQVAGIGAPANVVPSGPNDPSKFGPPAIPVVPLSGAAVTADKRGGRAADAAGILGTAAFLGADAKEEDPVSPLVPTRSQADFNFNSLRVGRRASVAWAGVEIESGASANEQEASGTLHAEGRKSDATVPCGVANSFRPSLHVLDHIEADSVPRHGLALRTMSCFCPVHTNCRLRRVEQSAVFPYANARRCCVEADGDRCARRLGTLYVCPHQDDSGEQDCAYAVCDDDYRVPMLSKFRARLEAYVAEVADHPIGWFLSFAFLALASVAYVPLVTTSVMVVSCHPQYQCVFQGCWANPTTQFVAAAYLSVIVLVTFGVGFPAVVLAMLFRRRHVLRSVFLGRIYHGRYAAEHLDESNGCKTAAAHTSLHETLSNYLALKCLLARVASAVSAFAAHYAELHPTRHATGLCVSASEYARFTASDRSVLRPLLYGDLRFECIPAAVYLSFGRVILLLAPLLLNRGSPAQLAAMAAAELVFFTVNVSLDVFQSSVLFVVALLGSLHQFAFIGLLACTTAVSYERDISTSTGEAITVATYSYIACVVAIAVAVVSHATCRRMFRSLRTAQIVRRLGLERLRNAPAYLAPDMADPEEKRTGNRSGAQNEPSLDCSLSGPALQLDIGISYHSLMDFSAVITPQHAADLQGRGASSGRCGANRHD